MKAAQCSSTIQARRTRGGKYGIYRTTFQFKNYVWEEKRKRKKEKGVGDSLSDVIESVNCRIVLGKIPDHVNMM